MSQVRLLLVGGLTNVKPQDDVALVKDAEVRDLVEDDDVERVKPTIVQVVDAKDLKNESLAVLQLPND